MKAIKMIITVLTLAVLSFGQWTVDTTTDAWTGETKYDATTQIESTESCSAYGIIESDGSLRFLTGVYLGYMNSVTLHMKTPDGKIVELYTEGEMEYAKCLFIADEYNLDTLINAMKKYDWVKLKLIISGRETVFTVNCTGFADAWNTIQSHK